MAATEYDGQKPEHWTKELRGISSCQKVEGKRSNAFFFFKKMTKIVLSNTCEKLWAAFPVFLLLILGRR